MLNLSKYRHAIVGCSAIATVACVGLLQSGSAIAQTATNNSNSSGSNVTTIPSVSVGSSNSGGSTPGGGASAAISGQAGTISSRVSVAQASYDTAVSNLSAAEAAQPVAAADTTPVRYAVDKGVADLAACGCPNADVTASAPSTAPRPEVVAAKAAEADAAAELAAAQAEARQFIESVKSGATATNSVATSQLW
ncbi:MULTISPECIES: hypothetical protein [unclassified Chamaesiphon]|uniref:hypothetical protein n=1 Tax=unclassified Chamaesiphon TaxID=2620921 RepID=UPI00286C40CE|nr:MULTISPECIES: hypothetical protein [unclassified Chamaesiphon]